MATYFVSQDGAGSKDGSSVNNASAIATFNAGTAPYNSLANNTVYFLDTITTPVTIPSSGASAASPATLRGDYADHPCTVDVTGATGIDTNSKHYLIIRGLTVTVDSTHIGIYVHGGSHYNYFYNIVFGGGKRFFAVEASDHTIIGNPDNANDIRNTGNIVGDYAIYAGGTGMQDLTINNVKLNGLTSESGNGGIGLWVASTYANNVLSIKNFSVSNATGGGAVIRPVSGGTLTINGFTANTVGTLAGSSYRGGIEIDGQAGITELVASIDNINITSTSKYGVAFKTIAFAANAYIADTTIASNTDINIYMSGIDGLLVNRGTITGGLDGVYADNSPNNTFQYLTISNVNRDGVSFSGTSTGNTVQYCKVSGAGQQDTTGSGDGFTAHDGCTGLLFQYVISANNKNSGFAFVGNAAGTVYNAVSYRNGDKATANMGVRGGFYNSGTGAWVVKNSVFEGNYPKEVNITAAVLGASTFDYNLYYHVGNDCVEAQAFSVDGGSTAIQWADYITAASGFSAGDEAHSVYGNPLFRSATDYHPGVGSPTINAGVDVGLTKDYAGRTIFGNPDIGAYEYTKSQKGRVRFYRPFAR